MALRPEIFVSAGAEFSAARKAVKLALLEIGAQPIEQLDATIPYGPLEGVLSQLLGRCEAVIHLVGPRYGLEPSERTLGAARRSFAQLEVDVANSLGKPIYYFVASPICPIAPYPPEEEEPRELQRRHRRAIQRSGGTVIVFDHVDELPRLIRGLRRRLVVRRRLAALPRPSLGADFVGRRQMLASLTEELSPGRPIVLHPFENAAGGTGTTTLANELAWKLYEDKRFAFVFHFAAGPRADIEASLAALARTDALALLPNEVASHRTRLDAVHQWFAAEENAGRWLVILDGVDNNVTWLTVRSFLQGFEKGAVLMTSQLTSWVELRAERLGSLSLESARDFLTTRLPSRGAAGAYAERTAIDQLAEMLGRLPLPLKLLSGHLSESGISPGDFLPEWMPDARHPTRSWRKLTAAALVEKSVLAMEPARRSLLHMLSCLAPEPAAIPLALFEHRGDWAQIRETLLVLERRALLTSNEASRLIYMHRAVREMIRDRLSPAEVSGALGAARATVDAALRRAESATDGRLIRDRLVPHCRALLGQLNGHPLEEHAGYIAQSLADWLKECGRPFEAEPLYRRALSIDEKHRKAGADILTPHLRNLAGVLRSTRRGAEAEALYRRALELNEAHYGADHSEVAADLLNLAGCMRAANRLKEAEPLYWRALQIEEHHAGRRHPQTAIVLNRLAGILELLGQPAEAETLYRRALQIDEETSGSGHPRIVIVMHNLAGLLLAERRYSEAADLYRRALAIDEAKFGRDEVEVTPALKGLASALEGRGARTEAEEVYRRAVAIDERAFGPSHPEVGIDLSNLSALLLDAGKVAEAEDLQLRAISIFAARRVQMRGPHPHLRSALANYTAILRAKGQSPEEAAASTTGLVRAYEVQPRRAILG